MLLIDLGSRPEDVNPILEQPEGQADSCEQGLRWPEVEDTEAMIYAVYEAMNSLSPLTTPLWSILCLHTLRTINCAQCA